MQKIRYYVGQENSEIIEEKAFEESIFASQYSQALKCLDDFASNRESTKKIVAFCGERGSGKSSCMRTVLSFLNELDPKSAQSAYLDKLQLSKIANTKFEVLKMIDPSFFDGSHNILDLVLGNLYGDILKYEQDHKFDINRHICNEAKKEFVKIKECLLTLKSGIPGGFSELQKLDALAHGVSLREHMHKLVESILRIKGKDMLVIPVDDIDLNVRGAYDMCEQLRKYLDFPKCIILLSYKHHQLTDSIKTAFESEYKNTSGNSIIYNEISDRTDRYIDKLIPMSQRVHMPEVSDMRDLKVVVCTNKKVEKSVTHTLKDFVVKQIFYRTRYLFYNSKGGVSPIVPNNLRELFHLIGMLWHMLDVPVDKKHTSTEDRLGKLRPNQSIFKTYFFNYWTKCLNDKDRADVEIWTGQTDISALNKVIVQWLANRFDKNQRRDYDSDENETESESNSSSQSTQHPSQNLLKRIVDDANFTYNVSVGDVFYLISLIQKEKLGREDELMLFFIKSLYSILLYEAYDSITEYPGNRYPAPTESLGGIYREDYRFDYTNELQRLVNGSYFTFTPGEFISAGKDGTYFDTRVVNDGNGRSLANLVNDCRDIVKNYDGAAKTLSSLEKIKDDKPEAYDKAHKLVLKMQFQFRMLEFFIFTLSRSIPQKRAQSIYSGNDTFRSNVTPAELAEFRRETGYYVFDILAPFAVITNPQLAYSRFENILGNNNKSTNQFFIFALNHHFSLLHQMCVEINGDVPYEDWNYGLTSPMIDETINRLQSDGIIRNAEVLMAMRENMQRRRMKDQSSTGLAKLVNFYTDIQDSQMATHEVMPWDESQNDLYRIQFKFLNPLVEFIKELHEEVTAKSKSNSKAENVNSNSAIQLDDFFKIFDSYEQSRIVKPKSLSNSDKKKVKDILKEFRGSKVISTTYIHKKLLALDPNNEILKEVKVETILPLLDNNRYKIDDLVKLVLSDEKIYDVWKKLLANANLILP